MTLQKQSFNAWIEQVGSYQKKIVRLSEPLGLSCFFDRKVDRWHGLAFFEILDPVGQHGYVMVDSVGGAISGVSLERHGLDLSIFEKQ